MALIINTNLASLNAQRRLVQSGLDLAQASERLSSGKRINTAADDAAGLTISNRMSAQIRGLEQARRNAFDGVSLIQVAEGALQEGTNILQRIRELSVQAANGIYSNTDRATLDAEVQQLVGELDRIAETTQFNGRKVLDGSLGQVALQVGAQADEFIEFSVQSIDTSELGLGSTSGDVIGAEMSLDGGGLLASDLAYSAIKINDRNIGGLTTANTVQDLLDQINASGSGVTASALVSITAPTVGDGVLTGGDTLQIAGNLLDGSSQSFSITNTGSLEELVEAINSKTGDLLRASIDDSGALVIESERMASITLQDTSQGSATGINETQIADPDIAELIEGLTSSWVAEAEDRIQQYYGIVGDGADLELDITFTDGAGGALASVSWTGLGDNMKLNVDMEDFTATGDPSGGSGFLYMDRIIAHEMTHAVMVRNMNVAALAGWFVEGTAELIHGGDERVLNDQATLFDQTELSNAFATGKGAGSNPSALGYSAAYLAVKMMHDDIRAAGGEGIIEVFDELKNGASLDAAIATVSGAFSIGSWNSLLSFEADFDANGHDYMTFDLNLGDADTGAIGGADYGGDILTAENVLTNAFVGPANDFNLIIPDEYTGGLITGSARLVLAADDGIEVTVTRGALGSDADLAALGLQTLEATGKVLGAAVSATEQAAALATGDLTINGVMIDSVAAGAGLAAKVDAINAASDATGVVASLYATESFRFSNAETVEFRSGGPLNIVNNGLLGINGIGILVGANDTAQDIAATINQVSDFTGASAYVDDAQQLHIFGKGNLVFGDSVGGALFAELGLVSEFPADSGSIELNGYQVDLTDIADLSAIVEDVNVTSASTGVSAQIDANGNLKLFGTAAINIGVGDVNGMRSLHAMGISFGIDGDEALTDTGANSRFDDETYRLDVRIQLAAISGDAIAIEVTDEGASATGLKSLNDADGSLTGAGLNQLSVATVALAQDAIDMVDNALETINGMRSQLGAVNNRLEFTVNNLSSVMEKTAAARSRIQDADFARETSVLTRAQVLQQASQSMLIQANAQPQRVLQLLN